MTALAHLCTAAIGRLWAQLWRTGRLRDIGVSVMAVCAILRFALEQLCRLCRAKQENEGELSGALCALVDL